MCLVNYTIQPLARCTTRALQARRTTSQSRALTLVKTVSVFTHIHGQRSYLDGFGLHYYVARWYDPATAHFAQADTIIPNPGNSGDWDRYAYVSYNPIRYTDSTGHWIDPDDIGTPPDARSREKQGADAYEKRQKQAVLQVDSDPVKQFDLMINDGVTNDWGWNSCGIAAVMNSNVPMQSIVGAAVDNGYSNDTGIQPSGLSDAYSEIFGEGNVQVHGNWDLQGMYNALMNGELVIIDMLIELDGNSYTYSTNGGGAHFARVIGIDFENQIVTIQNTLRGQWLIGDSHWEMPFHDFQHSWYNPEIRSDRNTSGEYSSVNFEPLDYWWISIQWQ